ncbi:MAG: sigma-70 family RNA polymerase sigma factor [Saprospiraceae bacterium]|nr:sigma-70 family RNA polymerase sigma factor [Saprospiraceae bacterium]
MTEHELIQACVLKERSAQKALYAKYSGVLFGICKRYVKQHEDAEDVLIETFYKIFSNIGQFGGKGSFEGWMKRIAVNESLMFLRKKKSIHLTIDNLKTPVIHEDLTVEGLYEQDLLKLLDHLAPGYRSVFNLFVIEGYKHREIAEMLGISINTSKSQLIQAKNKLKGLLKKNIKAVAS